MNNRQKWFLIFCFVLGLGLFPLIAQLQQSGGAGTSTSISQGGNTATVSAGGALKVDGSAATQPVSGTFWQATQPISGAVSQSGTWTVQPGNTPNTSAWLIQFPASSSTVITAAATTGSFAPPSRDEK